MGFWSLPKAENFSGLGRKAGIVGLISGAVVAVPIAVASIRNSRRPDDSMQPMSGQLAAPLPELLDYVPPPPLNEQGQPVMIQGRQVMGDHSRQVLSRGASGPNVSSPNLTRPDGRNAIDGSTKMVDLAPPVGGGRQF